MMKKILRKVQQFIKKCPLFFGIIVSTLALSGCAVVGTANGTYEFHLAMDHPLFCSIFLKEYNASSLFPDDIALEDPSKDDLEQSDQLDSDHSNSEDDNNHNDRDPSSDDTTGENGYVTEFQKVKVRKARSPYYSDNDQIALSTNCPYQTVDNSYFEDALFIGDSRIEGFKDYAGISEADFFCKEGLTVYDMMTEKVASVGSKKKTIADALQKRSYGKIYIMIGINELGLRTTKDYAAQYEDNLEQIIKLQPDAQIVILGIMHVTREYSDKSDVFNNDNIDDKNTAVAKLADGKKIFYLDMNPCVADDDGGVIRDYTWDGVHLKAEYYKLWADFMREHGLPTTQTKTVQ